MKLIALDSDRVRTLMRALDDAAVYRWNGEDPPECRDCDRLAVDELCDDHVSDAKRADAYYELASAINGGYLDHVCEVTK